MKMLNSTMLLHKPEQHIPSHFTLSALLVFPLLGKATNNLQTSTGQYWHSAMRFCRLNTKKGTEKRQKPIWRATAPSFLPQNIPPWVCSHPHPWDTANTLWPLEHMCFGASSGHLLLHPPLCAFMAQAAIKQSLD